MGNHLFLECNSGISGDMTVAALLDLGASYERLEKVIYSLPLTGFEIEKKRVMKSGIDCMDFSVILEIDNHDHDMRYLHGHEHSHEPSHEHSHRNLQQICEIIDAGQMTEKAKNLAKKIFEIVAKAEAKVHNRTIDQVHFHEVGAVDSIVDIVAVAVCMDDLDITRVTIPYLCEGSGTVRCQHGILSVPVPAVTSIVQEHALTMRFTGLEGEFVTPTGAAIAAALQTDSILPEQFQIIRTGLGAGKREYKTPGYLRAMLIQAQDDNQMEDQICKLETNIDDSTPEILGYTMEQLFEAGASDVFYTPIYMKKNRPAYLLTVLCQKEKMQQMEEIIFRETTTIGIRYTTCNRTVLEREMVSVDTKWGKVQMKRCRQKEGWVYYPEYERAVEIARKENLSLKEVYRLLK